MLLETEQITEQEFDERRLIRFTGKIPGRD
jgi:hypothetical protein